MSPAVTLIVIRVLAQVDAFVVVGGRGVAVVVGVGVLKNVAVLTTIRIPLHKGVLIVVHPHLQHTLFHRNFIAELLHQFLVSLLHLPPHSLRKLVHLLLLFLAELGPVPLSSIRAQRGQSVCRLSCALRRSW